MSLSVNGNNRITSKDYGISLVRVCSMLMIIGCHLATYLGYYAVAQFLNVGIYIFLMLSGYLYSEKEIEKPFKWLLYRWEKLCFPMYLWVLLIITYSFVFFRLLPSVKDIVLFLLNFQGLSWVFPSFPSLDSSGVFAGLGNLWFITVIYLCYVLMLVYKRLEFHIENKGRVTAYIVFLVLFFLLAFINVNFSYFLSFFWGYALKRIDSKINNKKKAFIILTLIMCLFVVVRLWTKMTIDNTYLYSIIIVSISHIILGTWIFYSIRLIENNKVIHHISKGKTIGFLDMLSYYVYITHNYFLGKQFALDSYSSSIFIRLFIFMILAIFSSCLIWFVDKKITLGLKSKATSN